MHSLNLTKAHIVHAYINKEIVPVEQAPRIYEQIFFFSFLLGKKA
jgi:predicted transcriptional regulator